MKRTTIITAKLKDGFFDLIRRGEKKYEVRDEPFGDARIIRYVSSTSGRQLGMFGLGDRSKAGRREDERLIKLAAIPESEFYELFPPTEKGGAEELWIAEILGPMTIDDLFAGEQNDERA